MNQVGRGVKPEDRIWDGHSDHIHSARISVTAGCAADDDRLMRIHFKILAHVGRQNASKGWLRLSQTKLAGDWHYRRSSVNRAFGELLEWGYIEKRSQKEIGGSCCVYRVVIDPPAPGGVSDTCDTPRVSDTCDRGVSLHATEVSRISTLPDDPSLYAKTDIADIADNTAQGDARPAGVIEPTEIISPSKTKGRRRPATKLPDDWFPNDEGVRYALEKGLTESQVKTAFEGFRTYWIGEGKRKIDWDATWRNRILDIAPGGRFHTGPRPTGRVRQSDVLDRVFGVQP